MRELALEEASFCCSPLRARARAATGRLRLGDQLRGPRAAPALSVRVAAVTHRRRRPAIRGRWSARVVLHSLFEELREEAELNARLADAGTESFAESLSYFQEVAEEDYGPRRHLSLVERAAATVDVPVIASLNCITPAGWTDYARVMQDAGPGAIELNIYYLPGDPRTPGRDVEQRQIDVLQRVKDAVTVPVAVKLGPYFSSTGRDRAATGRSGRRRSHPVQPLPAAHYRPRNASSSCLLWRSGPVDTLLPQTWTVLLRGRVPLRSRPRRGVEDAADCNRYHHFCPWAPAASPA
jgi:dihydroorotate dehydrogenase (fumarate)